MTDCVQTVVKLVSLTSLLNMSQLLLTSLGCNHNTNNYIKSKSILHACFHRVSKQHNKKAYQAV